MSNKTQPPTSAIEATPTGVFAALLRHRLVTTTAVSLVLSITAGPAAVSYFLGDYIGRWLDIQEQQVTSDSEIVALHTTDEVFERRIAAIEQAAREALDIASRSERNLIAICTALHVECEGRGR